MGKRESKRERMAGVLARWRRSGLSAAQFCRRNGIKRQALSYWKRALGPAARRIEQRVPRPTFVPLQIVDEPVFEAAVLEIVLASGDRVRVPAGTSVEQIRAVVSALRC